MAKSSEQNPIKKAGNISLLEPQHTYENLANTFLDNKKFGRDELNYFNLGVEQQNLDKVYSKNTPEKATYDAVPKFYKDIDTGEVRSYDNGKELRAIADEIANTMKSMQEQFGDKTYGPRVQADINAQIASVWKSYTRTFNFDDAASSISNTKTGYLVQQQSEMIPLLNNLKNNANISQDIRTRIDEIIQPEDVKFTKSVDAFLGKLEDADLQKKEVKDFRATYDEAKLKVVKDNVPIDVGQFKSNFRNLLTDSTNLSQDLKKEVEVIVQDEHVKFSSQISSLLADAQVIKVNDKNLGAIRSLQEENVNLRLKDSGPGYSKVVNQQREILSSLQSISQKLSKEPTITYGSIVAMNGSKPDEAEMAKAVAQILMEQRKITGLDPKSPDFKKNLDKIDPKSLKGIEILFEKQSTNKVANFKMGGKELIELLKKTDFSKIPDGFDPNIPLTQLKDVRSNVAEQLQKNNIKPKNLLVEDKRSILASKLRSFLDRKTTAKSDKKEPVKVAPSSKSPIPAEKIVFASHAREAYLKQQTAQNQRVKASPEVASVSNLEKPQAQQSKTQTWVKGKIGGATLKSAPKQSFDTTKYTTPITAPATTIEIPKDVKSQASVKSAPEGTTLKSAPKQSFDTTKYTTPITAPATTIEIPKDIKTQTWVKGEVSPAQKAASSENTKSATQPVVEGPRTERGFKPLPPIPTTKSSPDISTHREPPLTPPQMKAFKALQETLKSDGMQLRSDVKISKSSTNITINAQHTRKNDGSPTR